MMTITLESDDNTYSCVITDKAEKSFQHVWGKGHPDDTIEMVVRDTWQKIPLPKTDRNKAQQWIASAKYRQMIFIVERTSHGFTICDVYEHYIL